MCRDGACTGRDWVLEEPHHVIISIFFSDLFYVGSVCVCVTESEYRVRGQLSEVGSLLSPSGAQRLNSGRHHLYALNHLANSCKERERD